MLSRLTLVALLWGGIALPLVHAAEPAQNAPALETVQIKSTKDGKDQPARIYVPKETGDTAIPLVVVLHSWSAGYEQEGFVEPCAAYAAEHKWALVHPHFRGPNIKPEACASDLAVQDVLDSVAFMQKKAKIDPQRIYLVGTSGGGQMALIMAGRSPQTWAGVSAWVPVTDLVYWWIECINRSAYLKYAHQIEAIVGAPPGAADEIDAQYAKRSPLTHLHLAKGLPIDINTGITDGHTGSVPVSHSLKAFNVLAEANGKPELVLTDDQISEMTDKQTIPTALAKETAEEPGRQHPILFRRQAGPARITVFQGGHEGDMPTAMKWLAEQRRVGK